MVSGHEPEGGVEGTDWLRDLPRLVSECASEWDLEPTGAVLHGMCAVVIPCRHDGDSVMLKVTWPHPEAAHEHLALRAWDGDGAVRLVAADPSRWAMLLEALDPERPLADVDVDESNRVIGDLLHHLDRPAFPQLVTLSTECTRWAERMRVEGPRALPRRMAERAAAIFRELGSADDIDARLVNSDLHDENVLAGDRAPWLAIDPKPVAGVPEFAIAPLMWNRLEEAIAAPSARNHLRRRLEIACEAGGFSEELARDWTFARCALNAVWENERPDDADRDWISHMVTVCKAMQD
ncbi:hypothetical protein VV02_12340 [Luteipulveratus mongoliensis]|uniref:Aminoglycoside resistance protein n=2 Tax=Luteipulveratus mongoliensis TaxID=571913 RepID=A0A0K1JQK3_9MICO|nr:hypothetical protein VV02_12340 [Luteipulveratus mongoliensis]